MRTCSASEVYSGPLGGTSRILNPIVAESLSFKGELIGGDMLHVDMFQELGTYGYHTGTYDLADKTKVLVYIMAATAGGGRTEYMSVSGTLVVTSVSGSFSGTISSATFTGKRETDCTTSIPMMRFEGPIE